MRVIAGIAKGRRLTAPSGDQTRPTTDRVKEAMFSSLLPRLPGARIIDLFAGSGALGIEALSRGAEHVTFVERAGRSLAALRQNLELTALVSGAEVVTRDVATALRSGGEASGGRGLIRGPFDVALLDPPYGIDRGELAEVLADLVPHLAPDAIVVLELATRGPEPRWPEGLLPGRARRYGDTTLYEATAEVPAS